MVFVRNKISLKSWFVSRAIRPAILLFVILVALEIFHFVTVISEYHDTQVRRIDRLKKTLEIALAQKNVNLIENLLETAYIELEPLFVGICDNGSFQIALPAELEVCPAETQDLFVKQENRALLGTGGKKLSVKFYSLPSGFYFYSSAFFILLVTLGFGFISYRLIFNLRYGIIQPLTDDLFENREIGIEEIETLRLAHKRSMDLEKTKAVSKAIVEVSRRVAHDIKSPIGSIKVAIQSIVDKPDKSVALIENAHERMSQIISDLEQVDTDTGVVDRPMEVCEVGHLLESLVKEKRAEYEDYPIEFDNRCEDPMLKGCLNVGDFSRVISNLINNSVEASDKRSLIQVKYSVCDGLHNIELIDWGNGIPAEVLGNLFTEPVSFGKKNGRGIGLFSSKTILESWGGDLRLIETGSAGTRLNISIPVYNEG